MAADEVASMQIATYRLWRRTPGAVYVRLELLPGNVQANFLKTRRVLELPIAEILD